MENVPVDDDDRPLEEIKKTGVTVFVNLYSEPDEEEEKEKQKAEKNVDEEENAKVKSWFSNPGTGEAQSGVVGGGIGKYLKTGKENLESIPEQDSQKAVTKKKKVGVSAGFSTWICMFV